MGADGCGNLVNLFRLIENNGTFQSSAMEPVAFCLVTDRVGQFNGFQDLTTFAHIANGIQRGTKGCQTEPKSPVCKAEIIARRIGTGNLALLRSLCPELIIDSIIKGNSKQVKPSCLKEYAS